MESQYWQIPVLYWVQNTICANFYQIEPENREFDLHFTMYFATSKYDIFLAFGK